MAKSFRLASIDIFRAFTMLLMIFVNDLWTLTEIPQWLGHKLAQEDGMGLADVVFPAFLFIVGLSIPLAVQARKKKGDSKALIFKHMVLRTIALLVMGVFMVNLENINADLIPINKNYWQILMTLAFFLIWNVYTNKKSLGGIPQWVMQLLGVAVLIYLALIYQGGTPQDPEWMQTHWWGILGLIGWGYIVCAGLYLLVGNKILGIAGLCFLFFMLNAQEFVSPLGEGYRLVVSASVYASVMTGVLTTMVLLKFKSPEKRVPMILILLGLALLLLLFGFLTRPEWGISKIRATPSWTAICAAISVISFLFFYVIADRMGYTKWAIPIAPAGRSTLTCYLIPYYAYAIMALVGLQLPQMLTTGYVGIVKSLVFSFLIIFITGLLERFQVRLKI